MDNNDHGLYVTSYVYVRTYARVLHLAQIAFATPDYRFLICAIGTTIIPTIEVTATENKNPVSSSNK